MYYQINVRSKLWFRLIIPYNYKIIELILNIINWFLCSRDSLEIKSLLISSDWTYFEDPLG
jgi:hypothetical protein